MNALIGIYVILILYYFIYKVLYLKRQAGTRNDRLAKVLAPSFLEMALKFLKRYLRYQKWNLPRWKWHFIFRNACFVKIYGTSFSESGGWEQKRQAGKIIGDFLLRIGTLFLESVPSELKMVASSLEMAVYF